MHVPLDGAVSKIYYSPLLFEISSIISEAETQRSGWGLMLYAQVYNICHEYDHSVIVRRF